MENKDLQKMIDLYFDRELDKGSESILFISLSENEYARNYFRQSYLLRSVTENMNEDFPRQLEEKIFQKIFAKEKQNVFKRIMNPLFAYPVILILLFLCIFFYNEINDYRNDLNKIHNDLQQQKEIIQSILNPMPTTEIRGIYNNQIIIKAKKLWGRYEKVNFL